MDTKSETVAHDHTSTMATEPTENISDKLSKTKRKRLKNARETGDNSLSTDEGLSSKVSVSPQKSIAVPSTDECIKPGENSTDVSNEPSKENGALQTDHSVTPTKKKRKRKAKKNKFKTDESPSENEKDVNEEVAHEDGHDVGSGNTDVRLSRKERRKIKRKMVKEQRACEKAKDENESEPVQKKTKKRKVNDAADSSKDAPDEIKTSPTSTDGVNHDEVPENETSDLILVNSKRTRSVKTGASLKSQMESQLKSSQFRFLNEQLYKVSGKKAKEMFAEDGSAFLTYHEGFTQQVEQWPLNPVDIIIDALKKR